VGSLLSAAVILGKTIMFFNRKNRKKDFSGFPPQVRIQFESLKSNVILEGNKRAIKSLLFSSYHHGEGTSTVTASFAQCLAQDKNQKILLVDANTRTPALEALSEHYCSDDSVVFSDLFPQHVEKWVLPKPSPDCNLSLVQSGNVAYHPSQVFDHERFSLFMNSVTHLFDFVIFDSSPLGQYYDTLVLASHVDGVVLVVEAERTLYFELNRAKEMLGDANIPIVGVVMNRRRFHIPRFIFDAMFK
jgi:capsular exopolysaccharide synthesis family protein